MIKTDLIDITYNYLKSLRMTKNEQQQDNDSDPDLQPQEAFTLRSRG